MEGGRGEAVLDRRAPLLVGRGQVAAAVAVEGDDAAHLARVDVFLGVRGEHRAVGRHRHRGVEGELAEVEPPDLLAGAGVDGVDPAVRVAGDDEATAADRGDHRRRLGVEVGRRPARRRHPDQLAGLLVEGEETVPGRPQLAPASRDEGDEQTILVDHRSLGAAAVAGDETELLHQVAAPHHPAAAVEAEEVAADPLGVEIAGLRVAGEVGPADSIVRDRGVVDVEPLLPEQPPVPGVVAGNSLLAAVAFARPAVDARPSVEDDRGRAGGQRGMPDQVLPGLRPVRDQARLGRVGVLAGATPGRPFGAARGPGERSRSREQHRAQRQGETRPAPPPPRAAQRAHRPSCSRAIRIRSGLQMPPPLCTADRSRCFSRRHPNRTQARLRRAVTGASGRVAVPRAARRRRPAPSPAAPAPAGRG